MILASIMSGLGNQLFQYANARSISLTNNVQLRLDLRWFVNRAMFGDEAAAERLYYLHDYDIKASSYNAPIKFTKKRWTCLSWLRQNVLRQHRFTQYYGAIDHYDDKFHKLPDFTYVACASQSWKNFEPHSGTIKKELQCTRKLKNEDICAIERIRQAKNPVAIHIRRGDKAYSSDVNKVHGVCSLQYYASALKLLEKEYGALTLFVFTDDHPWAKQEFKMSYPIFFIDHNSCAEDAPLDLHIMTHCQHHVIANSTFSWWGAYLATMKGRVIAPDKWVKTIDFNLKDVYLPSWTVIPITG